MLTESCHSQCSICLNDIEIPHLIQLKCGHEFHASCIDEWKTVSNTCPLCRAHLCITNTTSDVTFHAPLDFNDEIQDYFEYDKSLQSFDGIKFTTEFIGNLEYQKDENCIPVKIICCMAVKQNPYCIKSMQLRDIKWEIHDKKLCLKEGTIHVRKTFIPNIIL